MGACPRTCHGCELYLCLLHTLQVHTSFHPGPARGTPVVDVQMLDGGSLLMGLHDATFSSLVRCATQEDHARAASCGSGGSNRCVHMQGGAGRLPVNSRKGRLHLVLRDVAHAHTSPNMHVQHGALRQLPSVTLTCDDAHATTKSCAFPPPSLMRT